MLQVMLIGVTTVSKNKIIKSSKNGLNGEKWFQMELTLIIMIIAFHFELSMGLIAIANNEIILVFLLHQGITRL